MQISGIQSGSTGLASSASKALNFAYYDPRDTNRDGIVSLEEDYTYSLNHPEVQALKRLNTAVGTQTSSTANSVPLNQYTQQGASNASGKTTKSLLDMYV